MKIVFGIMSAVHSAQSVDQLANALAPWPVVVHHDFSQSPDFKLTAPNIHLVSSPKKTGWAVWGFSEGIMHLLQTCLDEHDADYFQLLSPTCLPIRPVDEFAQFIENDWRDVHIGAADLYLDDDLEMNFSYRAFAERESFNFKLLRKLRRIYFSGTQTKREIANMQTLSRDGVKPNFVQQFALKLTRLVRRFGSHAYSDNRLRVMVGGTWFGCRKEAGEYLLSCLSNPTRREKFSKMQIPDEMMFSSVFWSGPFEIGAPNHFVNEFDEHNPKWIEASQLDEIRETGHFFARKFRDDPKDPARRQVLASPRDDSTSNRIPSKPSKPSVKAGMVIN